MGYTLQQDALSNEVTKSMIEKQAAAPGPAKPLSGFKVIVKTAGFTLVELLSVIMIISLLSVFLITMLSETKAGLISHAEIMKSHLRYAQTLAMGFNYNADTDKDKVWGLRFDGGNDQYWLFSCDADTVCDWSNRQVLPGSEADGNRVIQLGDAGIDIAGVSVGSPASILFDTAGRPFWVSGALTLGTPLLEFSKSSALNALPDDFKITLHDGAGNSRDIGVTPETGCVK